MNANRNNGNSEIDACGLDGDDDEYVKIRSLNALIARINRGHIMPTKAAVFDIQSKLDLHLRDEELVLAKIKGGITAIKYIGVTLVVLTVSQGNILFSKIWAALAPLFR